MGSAYRVEELLITALAAEVRDGEVTAVGSRSPIPAAAALLAAAGLLGIGRFLYFFAVGQGGGHIQSLILSGVLLVIAFQVGLVGLAADLIAANRRLLEEALFRLKILELEKRPPEGEALLWSAGRRPSTKDGQGDA